MLLWLPQSGVVKADAEQQQNADDEGGNGQQSGIFVGEELEEAVETGDEGNDACNGSAEFGQKGSQISVGLVVIAHRRIPRNRVSC